MASQAVRTIQPAAVMDVGQPGAPAAMMAVFMAAVGCIKKWAMVMRFSASSCGIFA